MKGRNKEKRVKFFSSMHVLNTMDYLSYKSIFSFAIKF